MQRPNKRTLHGSHSILALVFLSKRSSTTISYSLPTSCQASSSTINLIVDKLPVDSLLDDKFLFDAILGKILDVKLLDGDNFVPRRQIPRQTCSTAFNSTTFNSTTFNSVAVPAPMYFGPD